MSTQGAGQARIGVARAVDGVLEVHGHHQQETREAATYRRVYSNGRPHGKCLLRCQCRDLLLADGELVGEP